MHLAFLSSLVPPAAPFSGFDIANRVVVEALREEGVRVTSVGFALPGAEPAFPEETVLIGRLEPTNAKVSRRRKLAWLARALAHRTSFASAKMLAVSEKEFAAVLDRLGSVDGLILNSVQLAAAFSSVATRRPFLYLAHNVEHVSAWQNMQAAGSPVVRALFAREARHLKRQEALLVGRARHLWTLSADDAAVLTAGKATEATVLPLVTRLAPPAPKPAAAPLYDLGLIGTWTWEPNRVGLRWFLDEVTPHLPEDMTIAVAGTVGAPMPCRHPGLRFVGRVGSAEDFMRQTRVVPLASRGGTGVQLKTIETFEMGLPSVATSSALRGIVDVPANCRRADEPAAFAAALVAAVAASRADAPVLDGSAFHAAQRAGLAAGLRRGLAALN